MGWSQKVLPWARADYSQTVEGGEKLLMVTRMSGGLRELTPKREVVTRRKAVGGGADFGSGRLPWF